MPQKNPLIEGPAKACEKCKLKCLSLLPTLTIITVIVFFYSTYLVTYLLPKVRLSTNQFELKVLQDKFYNVSFDQYEWYFIIVHYLVFWFQISMMKTMFAKHQVVDKKESDMKLKQYFLQLLKYRVFKNLVRCAKWHTGRPFLSLRGQKFQ